MVKTVLMGFIVMAFAIGCDSSGSSSKSKCEQACDKIVSCTPGSTCQISGPCTGNNLQFAECILSKSCNQLSSCILGSNDCGDGVCNSAVGETCASCPADCGSCGGCGDGTCNAAGGETCSSCPADCGQCPAGECEQLCSLFLRGIEDEQNCIRTQSFLMNYDWTSQPLCSYGFEDMAGCMACVNALHMTETACNDIEATCNN